MVFRLQLSETTTNVLWYVGAIIGAFVLVVSLVRGCGYINGVPQKFAEQEVFIKQLGYPVGAKQTYRSTNKGGSDRSSLGVSYETPLSVEAVRSFYDSLMAERKEWYPLPEKDSGKKEWCKQDDRLSISIQKLESGETDAYISMSWKVVRHQPAECYR